MMNIRRARNVPAILKSLNDLRPRVEVAVKSGALPLIVSGDCISVLAVIPVRGGYYRNVSLMYMDRDGRLESPATTPSGCIDGMVISPSSARRAGTCPLLGRSRLWWREPDIALFGFEASGPAEEQYL